MAVGCTYASVGITAHVFARNISLHSAQSRWYRNFKMFVKPWNW